MGVLKDIYLIKTGGIEENYLQLKFYSLQSNPLCKPTECKATSRERKTRIGKEKERMLVKAPVLQSQISNCDFSEELKML